VGRNVRAYPEQVQRMAEMGCEVASHSYAHPDLTTLGHRGMLDELAKADKAFVDAIGYAPLLVRPPYGAVNKYVRTGSGRCMVTWTIDTLDWQSRDAAKVVEFVQSQEKLDGEVILLHSIHESTVHALEVLVPWLVEQGYQLVTVSELLAYYYGETLEPNTFYSFSHFRSRQRTDTPVEVPEEYPAMQIPEVLIPAPVKPVTPPAQPEVPVTPETPVEPEAPVTPETPVEPEVPVTPEVPVEPEVPVTPEVPVEPEVPVIPETPVEPEVPVTPEVPVEPEMPEAPEVPVMPEIPVLPDVPAAA